MSNEEKYEILGHIKDIRAAITTELNIKYRAQIEGHVWRARDIGKIIFLDITDGTGAIQIVCSKDKFDNTTWKTIKVLRKGNHIDVQGIVGVTERGYISVFADQVAVRLSPVCPQEKKIDTWLTDMAEEISGLFILARVKRVIQDELRELKYDEIETPFFYKMSGQYTVSNPLVKFYGWGPPIPIAISPAPLLRRAVLDGIHEVFAFSRVFSRDIRVGYGSCENFVLCVRKADPLAWEMASLGEDIIKTTFNNFRTAPKENLCPKSWVRKDTRWEMIECPFSQIPTSISTPCIFKKSAKNGDVKGINTSIELKEQFWIFWPSGLCLAEGHIEVIDGLVQIGGLMVYLDNLVMVILGKANIYLHRASISKL